MAAARANFDIRRYPMQLLAITSPTVMLLLLLIKKDIAEERGHTMQLRELLEAALRRLDVLERPYRDREFTFRGLRDGNGLLEWLGALHLMPTLP